MNPQSFFLVSLACFSVYLVAQVQAVPSVLFNFDLSTQTYDDLWTRLRSQLRQPSNPEYVPADVYGRYVLGPRRPDFHGAPLGWIMVRVTTGQASEETTLAIANDDLYPLGFKNSAGKWYILRDITDGLPGAIRMPFSESYYELIGGHMNLPTVPLGKQSAVEAVKVLASCDCDQHFDETTEAQVKQAMVRFIVMISEAARFSAIRATFSSSEKYWKQQTFITEDQAARVVYWGKISTLLVKWRRNFKWDGTTANDVASVGVKSPQDALRTVDFLLRPLNI